MKSAAAPLQRWFGCDFLLVSVENAPGAPRFANGDWSDLPRLLPIIDVLMQRTGWSVSVMQTYTYALRACGRGLSDLHLHQSRKGCL